MKGSSDWSIDPISQDIKSLAFEFESIDFTFIPSKLTYTVHNLVKSSYDVRLAYGFQPSKSLVQNRILDHAYPILQNMVRHIGFYFNCFKINDF